MIFLLFLLFVASVNAQSEIACDLFNYTAPGSSYTSTSSGGVGWRSVPWQTVATACDAIAFKNLTRFPFVLYATTSESLMLGLSAAAAFCGTFRPLNAPPTTANNGVVFLSALFVSNPNAGGWGANREFSFGLALASQNAAKEWALSNGVVVNNVGDSDAVALTGYRRSATSGPISFVVAGSSTANPVDMAWGAAVSMFVVMRFEWFDSRHGTLRYFVYDSMTAPDEVFESNLTTATPFAQTVMVDKLATVSLAMFKCHAAQVRVGKSFASVYSDAPSFLQRATAAPAPTSTKANGFQTTTATPVGATTTTTATTSTGTGPSVTMMSITTKPTIMPKATPSTQSASHLSLPDASVTVDAASSTTVTSSGGAGSGSATSCDGAASCGGCVGQSNCKWCSTGLINGRCVGGQDTGDGCDRLTLSLSGCETAPAANEMNDEASLPVAVIGGAVGGGIAALLLIALVIFCVVRSRGQHKSSGAAAPAEMATARESNSIVPSDIATGNSSNLYGDIRLANVYSSDGLTPTSVASVGSSTDPDPSHYTPLEMK